MFTVKVSDLALVLGDFGTLRLQMSGTFCGLTIKCLAAVISCGLFTVTVMI